MKADIPPKQQSRQLDAAIARLARRQHGVVSLTQLRAIGLHPRTVTDRVASGRLHRLHRGVFAVGHQSLTREGRWMAAVLWGGDDAALSHQAAGAHHGLRSWRGPPTITLPRHRRSTSRVRVHRTALPTDEIEIVDGITTTTVARTIFDLASVLERRALEQVVREAEIRQLTDAVSLPSLLERYPGRRGTAALKSVLADLDVGDGVTFSELENRFMMLVDRGGAPGSRGQQADQARRPLHRPGLHLARSAVDRRTRRLRGPLPPHPARRRHPARSRTDPRRLARHPRDLAPSASGTSRAGS